MTTSLRRLIAAWGLSVVAETAGLVALMVLAFETGGAALVAVFGAVRALPVLLVGPTVIGRSDRGRRERWVLGTLLARALLIAAAVGFTLVDRPLAALVCGAGASVVFTTHRPLNAAVMPAIARTPAELTSANAASAFAESAGALVGPVVAAIGLSVWGPSAVLTGCAVLALTAAGALAGVRAVGVQAAGSGAVSLRGVAAELSDGFRVLRDPPLLLSLTVLQTAARGILLVAVVVLAVDEFSLGEPGVGWLTSMLGVGGLAGALVAAWKVSSTRLARAVVVGAALWGAPMVVVGLTAEAVVAFAVFAVIGVGNSILDVGVFTLVARMAPRERLGRVFAALEVAIVVSVSVGSLLAGALIPTIGVRDVLLGAGTVLVLASVGFWRQARRVDSREVAPPNLGRMRACSALSGMPLVAIEHVAARAQERRFDVGEDVVVQGAEGSEFFVITSGQAQVTVDGRLVGRLEEGDGFGEVALLRHVPRTATVTAVRPMTTLVVDRTDFMTYIAGNPSTAASVIALAEDRDRINHRIVDP